MVQLNPLIEGEAIFYSYWFIRRMIKVKNVK